MFTDMMERYKNNGLRVEYIGTEVTSVTLVNVEFSSKDDDEGRYGLEHFVPQLDDYHDDFFLVFSVQLLAEISYRKFTDEGKLDSRSIKKFFYIVKFGRQIPKISELFAPVKEFKSPWFFVDMHF